MMRTLLLGVLISCLFAELSGQMNEKRTLEESGHKIYNVSYDPGGDFIVTTGGDHNIIIWNAESGIIHRTLPGSKKRPNQAVFGRSGQVLWSAGEGGLITCWDILQGRVKNTTIAHSGAINALSINPEGTMLISGGDDKMVRLWNIRGENPALLYELKSHRKTITSVAFSPDGLKAVSGSGDKTMVLWDVQSGGKLHEVQAHDGWVRCVSFSPDGSKIASGGDDGLIRIWEAGDLSPVRTLEGHAGWVQCLTYTASGRHLISGGHDLSIRIWDVETGSQEAVSGKLEQIVLSVDASPVRNDFISACLLSGKLRIWAQTLEPEVLAGPVMPVPGKKQGETTAENILTDAPQASRDTPLISIFSPMLTDGQVNHTQSSILIVGKAEARDGIQTVVVNRQRAVLNEAGVFQAEVALHRGDNLVELVAVSNTGKMGSSSLHVLCSDESAPHTAAVPAGTGFSSGRYYALIIGINEYTDEAIEDLDFPIKDAESMYEMLVGHYNFKQEDIIFLKNPTRTEMIISLDELGQKVGPSDNLLIFYAGHGFWDEKSNIGYWLPHDAALSNTANWFRNSTLRDFIGSINSKHTLLIADACFSGSIFKTRSGFSTVGQGVMKLHELPSRKAMTSGALKEVPDRSVFVKYLIKELDENREKYLPSESLFGNFKTAVLNNSPNVPQYGTIQNVGDEGGDFVFIRD